MKQANVDRADDRLTIGNSRVELLLDPVTGYVRDILNKETGLHHKHAEDRGPWPFGLRLGSAQQPDLLRVDIREDALHPQRMETNVQRVNGGVVLLLRYPNLLTTGGRASGVRMDITIRLGDNDDYFLIDAEVENGGDYEITNLFSGGTEFLAAEERQQEKLAVPGWSYGSIWENPFDFHTQRETFGYPIFGSQCGLDAGWMDLYGPKGGIGIGYLNRRGMTMFFNVQRGNHGLRMNWQLFNLTHEKATESWAIVGGVFGLKPGESFRTDPWILAPHAGDWHRMADIYRSEYERVFTGDYMTWEDTSETAKQIDVCSGSCLVNVRDTPGQIKQFSEVPGDIRRQIEQIGIEPQRLMVNVIGHTTHWPVYMPDFLQWAEQAGGEESCREMISELREMGVDGILFYTHAFYNHPKATDYIPEADTGYDHQNHEWREIGHVACLACDEWMDLWKGYIAGYHEMGISGFYLDQGVDQYLVCTEKHHRHGTDAVSLLTAHVNGMLELQQHLHDGYRDRTPFVFTEVGSDIQGRTMDVWTNCPMQYARGGEITYEIVRYTHPYRLCVDDIQSTPRGVNRALINGFIIGNLRRMDVENDTEFRESLRSFCELRRQLRAEEAPGYPYGFRDAVGLTVDEDNVEARLYLGESGFTVVYCAHEDTKVRISVNPVLAGIECEPLSFERQLEKNEAGFLIHRYDRR